ncbi:hypothetical protein [Sorangium sp. So ce861]|uniref:hypothetical protein n=1 Tax=Sorangium sp. So ce861 TaxID=3133323 RepID=UPI003F5F3915
MRVRLLMDTDGGGRTISMVAELEEPPAVGSILKEEGEEREWRVRSLLYVDPEADPEADAKEALAERRARVDAEEKLAEREAEVERLLAVLSADRAAVRALVDALPRCGTDRAEKHEAAATTEMRWDEMGSRAELSSGGRCEESTDLPYAAALRVLRERMKTWGDAADAAREPMPREPADAADPRWAAALAQFARELHEDWEGDAARPILAALAVGVATKREATLVLTACGYTPGRVRSVLSAEVEEEPRPTPEDVVAHMRDVATIVAAGGAPVPGLDWHEFMERSERLGRSALVIAAPTMAPTEPAQHEQEVEDGSPDDADRSDVEETDR